MPPPPGYAEQQQHTALNLGTAGDEGVIPIDYKYGDSVSQSSLAIRMAFVRKVYSILFAQLAFTTIFAGAAMASDHVHDFITENQWLMIVSLLGGIGTLIALYFKRHTHPLNLGLLAGFTFFESFIIAATVIHFETAVVMQALLLTLGIFIGLTLFTLQSKRDFSEMGPILSLALWALLMVGLVQLFMPFNRKLDLVVAVLTALVFSGFIVYDTQNIMQRFSPDEYIVAAVELYLDILNLFIAILRILNNANSD
ncbi:UPF0005-domain-containing protein [Ramicandelaber brevisporus]|nr:UPF0005-domain-containing protein [Ramicandelaber brevisporus]